MSAKISPDDIRYVNMNRILAVDADEASRGQISSVLDRFGYEVLTAADGEKGAELLKSWRPYLVFLSAELPEMADLALLKTAKSVLPEALFVVTTVTGAEEKAVAVLHAGGDNYLRKPFDPIEIVDLAQRYRDLTSGQNLYRGAAGLVQSFSIRMFLGNNPDVVTPAAQLLTRLIEPFFSDEDRSSIKLGLFEIIQNSIEHGSLEIDFAAKSAAIEAKRYRELIDKQRADPRFVDRSVVLEMNIHGDECRFQIVDQGPGFDWRNYMDSHNFDVLDTHGRGILMTRYYFDELIYNETGNAVTVVKKIRQTENV